MVDSAHRQQAATAHACLDIIEGVAGWSLSVLALHKAGSKGLLASDQCELLLSELRRCADTILACMEVSTDARTAHWCSPMDSAQGGPLTGFSHGNSGIAFALSCLYKALNIHEISVAAEHAEAFEDLHYDER